ncbi:MAG: TOBE domain-containing protein, partial [Roseococcus sp.]|nr:TOBE domain-containing protein [Roseococcus sp.]
ANPFVASFVGRSASFEGIVAGAGLRLADGSHLPAEAAHRHPEGSAVRAFIRPEDVVLGGDGPLSGTVTGIEYLGSVCRLELRAAGLNLHAEIAPREMGGLALGDAIPLALPPGKLMLFAQDA